MGNIAPLQIVLVSVRGGSQPGSMADGIGVLPTSYEGELPGAIIIFCGAWTFCPKAAANCARSTSAGLSPTALTISADGRARAIPAESYCLPSFFECFKKNVSSEVIPIESYPTTLRREIFDTAAKLV